MPRAAGISMTTLATIAAALALPGALRAQSGDTGYCNALVAQYNRYVRQVAGRPAATPNASVDQAMSKCGRDPGSAIPVLERALKDARIDLPPRG